MNACTTLATGCARIEAGRRHGFPTQALGEDAVFGVRFMENAQRVTGWISRRTIGRWGSGGAWSASGVACW
jgi:hypothetical protein